MFGVTKDELIRGLENLRLRLCCYSPQPTCDCKYGIDWVEKPTEEEIKKDPEEAQRRFRKYLSQQQSLTGLGEQTGCPELRQVIALLQVMPEDKFHHLTSRAHITVTDDSFTESLKIALKARGKYEIVVPSSSEKFMCASCKISYDKTDVIILPPNMIYCKDCLIGSIQSAIDELGVKEELPKPVSKEVWEKAKDVKFIGDDLHIETADGRKIMLKDVKIEKYSRTYESDGSLIVETPKITYDKVVPDDEPDKMISAIFNKLVDGLPTIQLTSREASEIIQAIKPVIDEYASHGFD